MLGNPDLHRDGDLWRIHLRRTDLRHGSVVLGCAYVRRRVYLSRDADLRRCYLRRGHYLWRTADLRPAHDLQLRTDMLEHFNLSRMDHLPGYRDLCAIGHVRRHSNMRRVHDLHRDTTVQPDAVPLSVPRRPGLRQRDQ